MSLPEMRCLYLENHPDDAGTFQRWLPMAWETLGNGTKLVVTWADSEELAEELLVGGAPFDLFVADIYMGSTPEMRLGLVAIEFARKHFDNLPIVALSMNDAMLQEEARKKGADEYVTKKSVQIGGGIAELGKSLNAAVLRRRAAPLGGPGLSVSLLDPDDLRLRALVETVDQARLAWFACEFAKVPVAQAQIGYLTSGESGAVVFRVVLTTSETGQPSVIKPYLLKVSRDQKLLLDETHGREKSNRFPQGMFVDTPRDSVLESSGWHAIASEFVQEARTMRDFVSDGASIAAVKRCLRVLWLDGGLREVGANPMSDSTTTTEHCLAEVFSTRRRARVTSALDELSPIMKMSTSQLERVRAFVKSLDLAGVPKARRLLPALKVWAHGDLHGQNVLVDRASRGWLIDPTNVAAMHWAADYARFAIDLFISCLDTGKRSYFWEDFISWEAAAASWLSKGQLPARIAKRNKSLALSLDWLASHQKRIHGASTVARRWELDVLLAIESLRNSYRVVGLTPMKRALAVSMAAQALEIAEARANQA